MSKVNKGFNMSYMEQKIQEQYEATEHKIKALSPLIEDLSALAHKHSCSLSDLDFAIGYLKAAEPKEHKTNNQQTKEG